MWSCILFIALILLNGRYANAGALEPKGFPSSIDIELSYQSIGYHKADHFVISIKDGQAKRGAEIVPIGAVASLVAAIEEPRGYAFAGSGLQRAHTPSVTKKKARGYGLSLVAPTGIESVRMWSTLVADGQNAA
jgi:hypothetical protein